MKVPWLSLFAASCAIDIFLQLMVFDGRVDGRSMQSALQKNSISTHRGDRSCNENENGKSGIETNRKKFRHLQEQYPGCIFDYSSNLKSDKNGGLWFDFMSDCGDGFNPSYQVARMLAQPFLMTTHNNEEMCLPRGQFLVNGGDLAYPKPNEFR